MSEPIRPRVIGGADSVRVGATGQQRIVLKKATVKALLEKYKVVVE